LTAKPGGKPIGEWCAEQRVGKADRLALPVLGSADLIKTSVFIFYIAHSIPSFKRFYPRKSRNARKGTAGRKDEGWNFGATGEELQMNTVVLGTGLPQIFYHEKHGKHET